MKKKRKRTIEEQELHDGYIVPVLPLRELVMFPKMPSPFGVESDQGVAAMRSAIEDGVEILLLTMKKN